MDVSPNRDACTDGLADSSTCACCCGEAAGGSPTRDRSPSAAKLFVVRTFCMVWLRRYLRRRACCCASTDADDRAAASGTAVA